MSKRRAVLPRRIGPSGRHRRSAAKRSSHNSVRESAAWVVERTLASLAPAESYLDVARAQCDERDHGLLVELSRGTLRWLRRLDQVIASASSRSFDRIESVLHAPLRVAAYQLFFLDRLPPHAIVNEAVEQAGHLTHRGGASFVNAVLRRLARDRSLDAWPVREEDPVRRLGIELSHPDLLVERWLEQFGMETTRRLLEVNNRPKPMHLLTFRDRGGRELVAEALIDEGMEVEPSDLAPCGLKVREGNPLTGEPFERGEVYVQDEASQLAALIPPPVAGEEILDVAAAPGGKTFALLGYEPEIRCWVADASLDRLCMFRHNLARLDRSLVHLVADAGAPPLARTFDRVVVDLPCSGTGTLRKHPELKWRVAETEIERLARQGRHMLEGMAGLVRRGGHLIAITCSLEKEENEDVVDDFLSAHGEYRRLPLESMGVVPVGEPIVGDGFWRLLPAADHDGFTVNVLHRCG